MLQWNDVGTILVPVDLDDPDSGALQVARAAGPRELHVVYVLHELEPSLTVQIDAAHRLETANTAMRNWLGTEQAPDSVRAHVRIGNPGQVVPELAEEIGADLVVLRSHQRKGLRRALLGSVAERLVRLCGCPVLVLGGDLTP